MFRRNLNHSIPSSAPRTEICNMLGAEYDRAHVRDGPSVSRFSHSHTVPARLGRHSRHRHPPRLQRDRKRGRTDSMARPTARDTGRLFEGVLRQGGQPADSVTPLHRRGRPCVADSASAKPPDSRVYLARAKARARAMIRKYRPPSGGVASCVLVTESHSPSAVKSR